MPPKENKIGLEQVIRQKLVVIGFLRRLGNKQKRTFAASQISGFNSPELPKKRPCIPPPIPEVAAIEVF